MTSVVSGTPCMCRFDLILFNSFQGFFIGTEENMAILLFAKTIGCFQFTKYIDIVLFHLGAGTLLYLISFEHPQLLWLNCPPFCIKSILPPKSEKDSVIGIENTQ